MVSLVIIFMALCAIFAGFYYIGSEYRAGTGFCSIAFGIIILIAYNDGKFDKYINDIQHDSNNYIRPKVIHDTINHIFIHETQDTVYIDKPLKQEINELKEDSIVVEIISEKPLSEYEIDSIANSVIYD